MTDIIFHGAQVVDPLNHINVVCDVAGSFNVNPAVPRLWLASVKRPDGSFVCDGISTDGGVFVRNVILSHGLNMVEFGALTLPEFVVKTSLNPARMLRLTNKGHLSEGADADITAFNLETRKPVAVFVDGKSVLHNGKHCSDKANYITTERGAKAIRDRGLKAIVVDPSIPYTDRFIYKN